MKIARASISDLMLIHDMADVVFRHTYKDILSSEQIEYMMEWMYSLDNLRKQLDEGHVYFIAYDDDRPCGYVSVQPEGTAQDGVMLGDFHIGNGFYMNDYIMGIDI